MRTFYIYKAIDQTNSKIYIGCTNDFERRIKNHLNLNSKEDCVFHRAIEEHGKDNFVWEIIETVGSQTEAYKREQYYIKEYNTIYPNGYNMTIGGRSHSLKYSKPIVCLTLDGEYVKRYFSAAQAKFEDGYCHTDILDCCKGKINRCKDKVFMFEDDYLKNGARIYEKPEPNGMRAVIQCDMQGNFIARYKSVSEAAQKTNTGRSRISSNLIGESKTANGFIFVYEENYPIQNIEAYHKRVKGRKIAQVDKTTGEIIKTFDRIADAGRELNVCYKNIHKALDKPNNTAFGYKWISI